MNDSEKFVIGCIIACIIGLIVVKTFEYMDYVALEKRCNPTAYDLFGDTKKATFWPGTRRCPRCLESFSGKLEICPHCGYHYHP